MTAYWIDIQHDQDFSDITDESPVGSDIRTVTTHIMVGYDAVDAIKMFEKLADLNKDRLLGLNGYIRVRMVDPDDRPIVLAIRGKANW